MWMFARVLRWFSLPDRRDRDLVLGGDADQRVAGLDLVAPRRLGRGSRGGRRLRGDRCRRGRARLDGRGSGGWSGSAVGRALALASGRRPGRRRRRGGGPRRRRRRPSAGPGRSRRRRRRGGDQDRLRRQPLGPERGHGDRDPPVVEDDRASCGRAAWAASPRGPGRSAGPRGQPRRSRSAGGRRSGTGAAASRRPGWPAGRPRRSGGRARPSCSASCRRPNRDRGRWRRGSDRGPGFVAGGEVRCWSSTAVMGARIPDGPVEAGWAVQRPTSRRLGPGRGNAKNPGDDLFSRKAALSVSSALESLTSVFGMGTGVASPLESPGFFASGSFRQRLDATVRQDRAGRRNGLRYRVVNGI